MIRGFLKSLALSSSEFNVPDTYLLVSLNLTFQLALKEVLRAHCAEKPTPHLYAHILSVSLLGLEGLWGRWDIADLSNDWEDSLASSFSCFSFLAGPSHSIEDST